MAILARTDLSVDNYCLFFHYFLTSHKKKDVKELYQTLTSVKICVFPHFLSVCLLLGKCMDVSIDNECKSTKFGFLISFYNF